MLAIPHHVRPRIALYLALAALLLGFATACETPIQVEIDVDPDANIANFQSYAWISAEPLIAQVNGVTQGPPISPIDDQRIRAAVDAQLETKRWKRVAEPAEADLVVSYGIGRAERTELYETPSSVGSYGRYGYRYGGWWGGSTVRSRQYTEGTLTIEFFDRRTKQAAWVGWASKRLSSSTGDRESVIERAVEKILRDFPSHS
jgi:hypothetical protein